jgi:hypothetical protein
MLLLRRFGWRSCWWRRTHVWQTGEGDAAHCLPRGARDHGPRPRGNVHPYVSVSLCLCVSVSLSLRLNLVPPAHTARAHAASPRNADDRFLPGWQNGATPTEGGTQCTCADGLPTVAPFTPPAEDAAAVDVDAGECWTDSGMNYNNHAHTITTKPATTPAACCDICSTTTGCKFWTHLGPTCWLKNSTVGRTKLSGAVSGGSGTKPHFPPPSHSTTEGPECDQGLRAGGGGQPCLWWSQGCSIGECLASVASACACLSCRVPAASHL